MSKKTDWTVQKNGINIEFLGSRTTVSRSPCFCRHEWTGIGHRGRWYFRYEPTPSVKYVLQFLTDFIADDGEDIESVENITYGLGPPQYPGNIDASPDDLNLFPWVHDIDDAELIARSIRVRYKQVSENSSNASDVTVPGGNLRGIVTNAVLWVDAELERDKQLDSSARGDVSVYVLWRDKVW